jgi:hypothetical protein
MNRIPKREIVLALLVILHLGVSLVHGFAHDGAHVGLSPAQMRFVITVILAGPVLGLLVQRLALPRAGAWLIAATMAAALAFGVWNHFLIPGADHVTSVVSEWRVLFGATAVLLAVTEALGAGVAAWCALTARAAA